MAGMALEGLAALADLIVVAVELLLGVVELCFLLIEVLADLFLVGLEFVGALFGAKWQLKRLKIRRPRLETKRQRTLEPNLIAAAVVAGVMLVLSLGYVGYHAVWHRNVAVVLKDGSRVALAKFVVDHSGKQVEIRTTVNGELKLPRFRVNSVHVQDSRFRPKSWPGSELPSTVVLERTEAGELVDVLVKGVKKAVKAVRER